MHRGYIKLWRKLQDSKHFSMGLKHVGMFNVILILANKKTGYFLGHEIQPGQYATSVLGLSERVIESRKTVRKILKDLTKFGMIKYENISNRFTLITVCNWGDYQHTNDQQGPTEGATEGQPREHSVPLDDPQSENDKNDKKDKNNIPTSSDVVPKELSNDARNLCVGLRAYILRNDPKAKVPDVSSFKSNKGWGREARIMMDADGREYSEIAKVIKWATSDSFWRSNILSMTKLRKQYTSLKLAMEGNRPGKSSTTGRMIDQNIEEYRKLDP